MVNSISAASQYQYQPVTDTKLTDDQKKALQDIIAKYDPATATKDSMKSMFDEIKAAGIQPGQDLKQTLESAGFKTHKAHGHHKGGSSSQPAASTASTSASGTSSSDLTQQLLDFLKKQETGNANQDDVNSIIKSLLDSGQTGQGAVVDQKV